MIQVSSDVWKHKECLECYSTDRVLRIEMGDKHTKTFFLCNRCCKELFVQLDMMVEGINDVKEDGS